MQQPPTNNVNLLYVVLPQRGRGIGVTMAIIRSLAECFRFSLYWTIDDDIQLRWLDWIFLGGYLRSLSINYIAMSEDMGKRLTQLYYIKMKISYDLAFIAIGVAIAT